MQPACAVYEVQWTQIMLWNLQEDLCYDLDTLDTPNCYRTVCMHKIENNWPAESSCSPILCYSRGSSMKHVGAYKAKCYSETTNARELNKKLEIGSVRVT